MSKPRRVWYSQERGGFFIEPEDPRACRDWVASTPDAILVTNAEVRVDDDAHAGLRFCSVKNPIQ